MDGPRFDVVVRALSSRRTVLRTVFGIGAALAVTHSAEADATCLSGGAQCVPLKAGLCCSRTCDKHKGKFRCAPVGSAYGCGKQDDICIHRGEETPCPEPSKGGGGFCIAGAKGQPLCIIQAQCAACRSDADCTDLYGPTARCLNGCLVCEKTGGGVGKNVCVLPA